MIVADANLLVYHLAGNEDREAEIDALYEADTDWTSPQLAISEVRNALAGLYRDGALSLTTAQSLAEQCERLLADRLFGSRSGDVLQLVDRSNRSAYDCEYVSLAGRLEVPLVTYDGGILADFPEIATTPTDFLARK